MKLLTRIVQSMEKEDLRNFRLFAERVRSDQFDRKIIDLFDAVLEGTHEDDDELQDSLYPGGNRNAYYRLKNRLLTEVQRSLLVLHHDLDPQTQVMKLLMISRWLQFRAEWEGAGMVLEKAAKLCEKERIPRWHMLVYEEWLALSREDPRIDPLPIVERLRALDKEYQGWREFSQTLALVSHRLRRTNLSQTDQEMVSRLREIQEQLMAMPAYDQPDHHWQLHQVVRETLLEQRDYANLETYLLEAYGDLQRKGAFAKAYLREKIVLLSWIVNTLSQNRKFHTSLEWAERLHEALQEQNQRYFQAFCWTYSQALVVNFTCLGQLDQAIQHLLSLQESSKESLPVTALPFLTMNLIRLLHYQGETKAALQHLMNMINGDQFQSLSTSIQLSAAISELILRIEGQDAEFAAYRYKELRRKFRPQLDDPAFTVHMEMLNVLRLWIKDGQVLPEGKARKLALAYLRNSDIPLNAGEVINYKGWMYAKLARKNVFEVARDWMLNPPGEFDLAE